MCVSGGVPLYHRQQGRGGGDYWQYWCVGETQRTSGAPELELELELGPGPGPGPAPGDPVWSNYMLTSDLRRRIDGEQTS